MLNLRFTILIISTLLFLNGYSQNVVVDGVTLVNSGGTATTCIANGYKLNGTATPNGGCVSLTQSTFDAGGMWICDPINLNQSFKVYFEVNFDSFNSGDGMAFVLQTEGVPDVLGGEGGGLGYTYGNASGCLPAGDCNIDPSVVIEFDIWNNSADFWNGAAPAMGTINDISCDHATILKNGDQTAAGTLAGPNCLLPTSADVTDGLSHDVCIIWDVINLQYSMYFDSSLVTTYNGDIRTNFVNPAAVNWGFTAGSGGANQNQRICNVDMVTNPTNPSCICSVPVASYSPNPSEICSGQTTAITLSSTALGTTFNWSASNNSNVTGQSTTTQTGQSIAETLTNTTGITEIVNYTVTPILAGCATGADIVIPVSIHPTPSITGTLTTCVGSTTTLVGSGTVHPIIPWMSDNGSVASITNGGVASGLSSGSTVITYLDNNNCQTTETVTVYPLNDASFTTTNFCEGTISPAATTSGTGGGTFAYNPDPMDGSTVNASTGSIIGGIGGSTYTIEYTTSGICPASSTQTVTVYALPPVSAGSNFDVCEGEQTTLNGSGASNYVWNPSTIIDGQAFTPSSTATYTVTGTDINGCINSDDITVTIEPSSTVSFVADLTSGCAPFTVTFTNTTGGNLVDCNWTMNNGTPANGCGSVTTTFPNAGVYDITLSTISSNGCTGSETYLDYIYVEDVIAAFTPSPSEISSFNQEVVFSNNSTGAVSYLWDFGDTISTSTIENPSHTYIESQSNYAVELVAYSSIGCTDTAWQTIVVNEEPIFYIPNTFTPNGDELNQNFNAVFTSGFDSFDFNFYIYSRWGELIWQSTDSEIGWDGTYGNSSNLVQDGIYTWKIDFKVLNSDERIEILGHVNVLR